MASPSKTAPKKPAARPAAPKAKAPAKKKVEPAAAPAKAAPKPVAAKASAAAKAAPAKAKKTAAPSRPAVSPGQRLNYVEVAAYFIAERNGFVPGRELENWAAAEAEIDRLLSAGLLNNP